MTHFDWQDYTKNHAPLVESWLDADTVRLTGLDEGFDEFFRYWRTESDPLRGELFWCKLVSENRHPLAVIAYGYFKETVTIMEIILDPNVRGQGKGTAIIQEFIKNAAKWIKQPISLFVAVVFEDNPASQKTFCKLGFVQDEGDTKLWKTRKCEE